MRGFIVILPLLLTLLAKTAQAGLSCVKEQPTACPVQFSGDDCTEIPDQFCVATSQCSVNIVAVTVTCGTAGITTPAITTPTTTTTTTTRSTTTTTLTTTTTTQGTGPITAGPTTQAPSTTSVMPTTTSQSRFTCTSTFFAANCQGNTDFAACAANGEGDECTPGCLNTFGLSTETVCVDEPPTPPQGLFWVCSTDTGTDDCSSADGETNCIQSPQCISGCVEGSRVECFGQGGEIEEPEGETCVSSFTAANCQGSSQKTCISGIVAGQCQQAGCVNHEDGSYFVECDGVTGNPQQNTCLFRQPGSVCNACSDGNFDQDCCESVANHCYNTKECPSLVISQFCTDVISGLPSVNVTSSFKVPTDQFDEDDFLEACEAALSDQQLDSVSCEILNVREEGVNGSDTFVDFFVPISQIDRETVDSVSGAFRMDSFEPAFEAAYSQARGEMVDVEQGAVTVETPGGSSGGDSDDGISGGAIAGIIIALIIVAAILGAVYMWHQKQQRTEKYATKTPEVYEPQPPSGKPVLKLQGNNQTVIDL